MSGNVVTVLKDQGQFTLPERTRRWEIDWQKEWLLGKYTVELQSKIDPDAAPVKSEFVFYAFPVIETAVVLLSVSGLILIIRGRHRIKKALGVLISK